MVKLDVHINDPDFIDPVMKEFVTLMDEVTH
jgi:hypothetical protein